MMILNQWAVGLIIVASLAGCNAGAERQALPGAASVTAPPFGTSTPPPFGTPRNAQAAPSRDLPIQRTTVNEQTTVSPDGRNVRTERTTTRVGFDPDRAAAAVARLASASGPTVNQGIPGAWQMQSSSNQSMCTVNLYGGPQETSGSANSVGCPSGGTMQGITGWRYEGGKLSILKGSEVSIVMNQLGPNRFDGTATWGFLTTKIALYR